VTTERGMEFNFGQMEQNMKANGKTIRLMEKENLFMLMETLMMVIG
jgi:hypothetical protein